MLAMFVHALYNVVDTIFVGRGVGPLAIGALTAALPIQIFMMAIAMLLGTGAASVVSRALGAGDRGRAVGTAGTVMTMAALLGVLIAAAVYVFVTPILRLFGASETLLPFATDYVQIVLFGAPFLTFAMATNNLIRSEGNARMSMLVMMVGAIVNIILDPIFIFGLDMGIRGAALATAIGQFLSCALSVFYYVSGRSSLGITTRALLPSFGLLKPVAVLGLPAFIRQFGGTFVAALVNNIAVAYGGDLAIASFGMINRVLIFALMPVFGLAQGFQPIAGFNYGAGRMDRVRQSTRLTSLVSAVITGFFFVLMVLLPNVILSMFTNDAGLLAIAAPAMRIVVFVLPLVGVQVVGATFFLAVGKAIPSLFLGMLRQIILLIPLVAVLPPLFGLKGLWFAFPIADTLAAAITLSWLTFFIRRRLDHAAAGPAN